MFGGAPLKRLIPRDVQQFGHVGECFWMVCEHA